MLNVVFVAVLFAEPELDIDKSDLCVFRGDFAAGFHRGVGELALI